MLFFLIPHCLRQLANVWCERGLCSRRLHSPRSHINARAAYGGEKCLVVTRRECTLFGFSVTSISSGQAGIQDDLEVNILKYVDLYMRKRAYVSQEEELHKTDRKEGKSESETTPPHHLIVLYIVASGVPLLSDKSRPV